jgi:hypothetical protein
MEPQSKQGTAPQAGEQYSADFILTVLAEQLRPLRLSWFQIVVVICFTIAPILFTWFSNNAKYLVGLVVPFVFVHTIRVATLRKRAKALRAAFMCQLWDLPPSKRKALLDIRRRDC